MSKQTAVEWLENVMMVNGFTLPLTLFEQARQMEKDQNAEAYKKGWDEGTDALYKEVRKIYDANKIFYNIDN